IGTYNNTSKEIQVDNPDPDQSFWRDQKLVFKGTPLSNVIESLNRNYQANITLQNEIAATCKLSATFEKEQLANIIDVIATTFNLEISNENNAIILKGKGCKE
ncbi:MAG: DUF4974 domain-containing protein, partial [Bacteroidota bacterium]